MDNKSGKRYRWVWILVGLGICLLVVLVVFWSDYFSVRYYTVQGIDVSHYQGEIDWKKIAEQEIEFAYIKATEGSGSVDERFHENWKKAQKTDLLVGAYHFFSFDSTAEKQAENYISTVGALAGKLIPVVDVEYYGDKRKNKPDQDLVIKQLQIMLDRLEETYCVKPAIYSTRVFYQDYIRGKFAEYPLWIRNVHWSPQIDMRDSWTFWQYTDRAVMNGYQGGEKYIDRNVFAGSRRELEEYLVK